MLQVKINRNHNKQVTSFIVIGHASSAPYGKDIVCAAVSAITQTIIYGIIKVVKVQPELKIEEGLIECYIPGNLTEAELEKVGLLLETMILGLEEIQKEYTGYIQIENNIGGEQHEI